MEMSFAEQNTFVEQNTPDEVAPDDNHFEDLSGTPFSSSLLENPFDAILDACDNDLLQIQSRYETHRETRNAQQKAKLLAHDFPGWIVDPILQKLIHRERNPDYVDPRHCLVFWARPPRHIQQLVNLVQQKLRTLLPDLWLMPLDCLHMTALEVAHSMTGFQIEKLLRHIKPIVSPMTNYPFFHRARLIKPLLSYDNQAIALSFLPASNENIPDAPAGNDKTYTYHHLRRDLYGLCTSTGVSPGSRYVVPSAHLTIARFVTERKPAKDDKDQLPNSSEEIVRWVHHLEETNTWLKEEFWPQSRSPSNVQGEWVVGEERGLECRAGTLWYGGGWSVDVGRWFTVPRAQA